MGNIIFDLPYQILNFKEPYQVRVKNERRSFEIHVFHLAK